MASLDNKEGWNARGSSASAYPRQLASLMDCILSSIRLESPPGYLELLGAVREAEVVVTDAGGVRRREAFWLGPPCITIPEETEWQETVACGADTLLPPGECGEVLPELVTRCRRRRGMGT